MIKKFEELLLSTKREGIEALLEFIRKSDFYTAPASTKYHSCHEGGLLEHSLNVYECLKEKRKNPIWEKALKDIPEESFIISALLHDLCKTYFYVVEYHNKKNDETGIWEKIPFYTIDDKMPLGHGEKSVYIITGYMKLTREEAFAIRYHMGYSSTEDPRNVSAAFEMFPLAFALSVADSEATYFVESEINKK